MTTLLGGVPCMKYPEDGEFKTIGLSACPFCRTHDCWLHYLRWEVKAGVKLNVSYHHLVTGHWPDCAVNHQVGAQCDMGPECGSADPKHYVQSVYGTPVTYKPRTPITREFDVESARRAAKAVYDSVAELETRYKNSEEDRIAQAVTIKQLTKERDEARADRGGLLQRFENLEDRYAEVVKARAMQMTKQALVDDECAQLHARVAKLQEERDTAWSAHQLKSVSEIYATARDRDDMYRLVMEACKLGLESAYLPHWGADWVEKRNRLAEIMNEACL